MRALNIIGATVLAAVFPIVTATAGQTTTDKTKVEIKDGKDVTVAGCLDRTSEGRFVLTTTESGSLKYVLVTDDDLGKYVGHEVEVKGKADPVPIWQALASRARLGTDLGRALTTPLVGRELERRGALA